MFERIKSYFIEKAESRKFNAHNCLLKQEYEENKMYQNKIEEIENKIKYVTENSRSEHAVIYHVYEHERKMFEDIKMHFMNLGFKVMTMTIPELKNEDGTEQEFIIIAWKY